VAAQHEHSILAPAPSRGAVQLLIATGKSAFALTSDAARQA
jgi:hypothetical protein